MINLLGLSPRDRDPRGLRRYRPASRSPWRWFALGFRCSGLGDLYTYSYPRLFHHEVPFPSIGDAAYLVVYPALMAGLLILVRRRNPERDRARAHRLADHHAGPLAALLGRADRSRRCTTTASRPSRSWSRSPIRSATSCCSRPPIRLAVDTGARQPAFYLLAASIVALLVDRLRLRPRHPRGRLRRPGLARRRLDQLLPAVGRGGAASLDGRARARCPGPRCAPHAAAPRAAGLRVADGAGDGAAAGHRQRGRPARGQRDASIILFGLVVDAHGRPRPPAGALRRARADPQRRGRRPGRRHQPRGHLPRGARRRRASSPATARPRGSAWPRTAASSPPTPSSPRRGRSRPRPSGLLAAARRQTGVPALATRGAPAAGRLAVRARAGALGPRRDARACWRSRGRAADPADRCRAASPRWRPRSRSRSRARRSPKRCTGARARRASARWSGTPATSSPCSTPPRLDRLPEPVDRARPRLHARGGRRARASIRLLQPGEEGRLPHVLADPATHAAAGTEVLECGCATCDGSVAPVRDPLHRPARRRERRAASCSTAATSASARRSRSSSRTRRSTTP